MNVLGHILTSKANIADYRNVQSVFISLSLQLEIARIVALVSIKILFGCIKGFYLIAESSLVTFLLQNIKTMQ
jgi:hypothetical protein